MIEFQKDENSFRYKLFVALNAGADYIVTNDRHFNILKTLDFPPVKIVDIETFKSMLL